MELKQVFNFYALMIILSGILDVVTTFYGLKIGLTEGNFLSFWIISKIGFIGIILLHLIVVDVLLILGLILKDRLEKEKAEDKKWMFMVILILRLIVVTNNIILIAYI